MQRYLFALIFVILSQFFPAYAIDERSIIRSETGVPIKEKKSKKYIHRPYQEDDDEEDDDEYEDEEDDEDYVPKRKNGYK